MRSFGATKFIPRVSEQSFEAVVKASQRSDVALPLWQELKEEIYSLSPEASLSIGKPSAGHVSAYYPSSPAPSDAQVDEVQALCDAAGISTANTRLSRVSDTELVLLVASISALPSHYPKSLKSEKLGFEVRLQAGDYADALAKVDAALAQAGQYAANDNQREMLKHYAKSFETGNIEAHKEGSRSWVKDVGPVVECASPCPLDFRLLTPSVRSVHRIHRRLRRPLRRPRRVGRLHCHRQQGRERKVRYAGPGRCGAPQDASLA